MSLYVLFGSWSLFFFFLFIHCGIVIQSDAFLQVNLNAQQPNPFNTNIISNSTEKESKMITMSTTPVPPLIIVESPRIQCTEVKSTKMGEGRVMATEMCPAKIKHMIGKSVTDLRCQPRPEIVKLQLPGPNFDLHPSVAEVKRCNGFCGTPTSCLPTKITIKQVPVFTIDKARLHMFAQECAMVELEEHEECRCTCAVKASHCGPNQKFERGNCACVCMNHEAREECEKNSEKGAPRQWDPATCTCRCVQESLECASGFMWSPTLCSSPPSPQVLPSSTEAPRTLNGTLPSQNNTTLRTLPFNTTAATTTTTTTPTTITLPSA